MARKSIMCMCVCLWRKKEREKESILKNELTNKNRIPGRRREVTGGKGETNAEGGRMGGRKEQTRCAQKKSPSKCLASVWRYVNSKRMELNATEKRRQERGKDNNAFESEVKYLNIAYFCWYCLNNCKHLKTTEVSVNITLYSILWKEAFICIRVLVKITSLCQFL